jgi:hypothetical protein
VAVARERVFFYARGVRRLQLCFFGSIVLSAAGALGSLAACVGDDPATSPDPATADDASVVPMPTADSSTADTRAPDSPDAADAGGGDAAPKRFCATQAPLTGVTDFFCADFDGTKADEGFTTSDVPDGGALTLATDAFFSAPASLLTKGGATLVWEKISALPFLEVDVDVHINVGNLGGVVPPSTGYLSIVRLESIDSNIELRYTNGGTAEGTTYTGYYVTGVFCPNACALVEKKLSNTFPTNVWTDVQMVWQKTGAITVNLNSLPVVNMTGVATTSTKVSAQIGVVTNGNPVGVGTHAYDNLVVSVKR